MKPLLLLALLSTTAFAATDGSLDGTASTGTVAVNVAVTELVRVSFPNGDIDIPFSTTTTTPITEEFCIYTNAADGGVGVAISVANNPAGVNQSAALFGGGSSINYSFDFETIGGATLASNINENGMAEIATATANTTSASCAGGNSHQFVVTVLHTDMAAAPVGSYSDTITVVIEPAL